MRFVPSKEHSGHYLAASSGVFSNSQGPGGGKSNHAHHVRHIGGGAMAFAHRIMHGSLGAVARVSDISCAERTPANLIQQPRVEGLKAGHCISTRGQRHVLDLDLEPRRELMLCLLSYPGIPIPPLSTSTSTSPTELLTAHPLCRRCCHCRRRALGTPRLKRPLLNRRVHHPISANNRGRTDDNVSPA